MNKKLTLNIDKNVISQARVYAKNKKRSISKLVEDYLSSIAAKNKKPLDYENLGHITKELIGVIKIDEKADCKNLLEKALTEKYL